MQGCRSLQCHYRCRSTATSRGTKPSARSVPQAPGIEQLHDALGLRDRRGPSLQSGARFVVDGLIVLAASPVGNIVFRMRGRPGVALYYFDRRANWRGGWPKMGRDRLRQGRVDRACRADEGGREHRVPLSKAALAILRAALREDGNPFVFIGGNKGSAQQHGDARAAAAAHGAFLFQIGSGPRRLRATTCASIVIGVCGSHCHAGPGIWDSPVGLGILGRNEWLLPRNPCRAQAVAIGAIP
ncbi:hypothetical protein SAMN02990966_07667 [Rhodospirillales bacterium URHD0017]|nr:hypothetical protein SAMN02990966_07667 [Rhodospirillales bacterium URHD0017]